MKSFLTKGLWLVLLLCLLFSFSCCTTENVGREISTNASFVTQTPTQIPIDAPTQAPTDALTQAPTDALTQAPTDALTQAPTDELTQVPTDALTQAPTDELTQVPTEAPTDVPSQAPTEEQTTVLPGTLENGVGVGHAKPVSLSSIPAFSGKAYVAVDGNIPNFSAQELSVVGYETYSSLDKLGRTGVALACVGKDTMPADGETRGDISKIKPTGWVQASYDCVSGGWLYNRCHLIGWQLSAENANAKNLLTGTKYLNISGMLPFENMVADYIKETGNHVAYRITPIYDGNNLLASGVQMEAYSVEDCGEGIQFNVFCYNVQPEITINYATGESVGPLSEEDASEETTEKEENSELPTVSDSASDKIVYRTPSGKRYHFDPDCGGKNSYIVTLDEATGAGLTPCQKCAKE